MAINDSRWGQDVFSIPLPFEAKRVKTANIEPNFAIGDKLEVIIDGEAEYQLERDDIWGAVVAQKPKFVGTEREADYLKMCESFDVTLKDYFGNIKLLKKGDILTLMGVDYIETEDHSYKYLYFQISEYADKELQKLKETFNEKKKKYQYTFPAYYFKMVETPAV